MFVPNHHLCPPYLILTPPKLDIVAGQLRDDPENSELAALKGELSSLVDMLDESIAELKPKEASKLATKPPSPPVEPEKWSRENHPAFKKATATTEESEDAPVTYRVNDTVMAKWVSGDKGFYNARITSITGSSANPIYVVKFKAYDTTETLRSKDIRPLSSNKRKADGPPTTSTPPIISGPGVVSSAGATTYPEAQKASQQKPVDPDAPPKPKKIRAKKELEAGKNKWQEFNAKGKFGKKTKKESMFRTPEGVNARGKLLISPSLPSKC